MEGTYDSCLGDVRAVRSWAAVDNRNPVRNDEESRLAPQLGVGQALAIALGAMLGVGVYVSMGRAAGTTGGSLLVASSLALLVYYWVMNLSALRLPAERRLYPVAVPVAGIVANLVVGLSLPWQTLAVAGAVAAADLAYFELLRRLRR